MKKILFILLLLPFIGYGQTTISGSSFPQSILQCKNEYVAFPDGTRLFNGLLVKQGNRLYYLDLPYTVEVLGQSLVFDDSDKYKDKVTVYLNRTAYATMVDFLDAAKACGSSSGGVSTVDVAFTSDGTLTVTVNGVSDFATIGPAPHIDTVDPDVNDDFGNSFRRGQLWVNTTDNRAWIAEDVTNGAAVWLRVDNIQINSAATDPTVGDDSADGYEVGSYWVNTATPEIFFASDVSVGAAVWVSVSGGILDNFTAIIDPVVGDDDLDGYSPGSRWYNTVLDRLWICVDNSTGAAIWLRVDNRKYNQAATNPTVGDDDGDGYEFGSIWHNTVGDSLFFCADASTGAADWISFTVSASSGGRFTYEPVTDHCIVTATALGVTAANVSGTTTITVPDGVDLFSVDLKGTTVETDGSDALTVVVNYGGTRNHDNDIDDMRVPHILVWDIAARLIGGPTTGLPFIQDGDNTPQRQIVGVGGGSPSITVRVISLSSTYSDWIVKLIF